MAYINHDVSTMAMPSGMNRMGQFPLDMSSVYYDEASLKAYAESGAIAYVGQIVSLVDADNGKVTVYSIQDTAGTLKEVGTVPVGDESTIVVDAEGKISLAGMDELVFERDILDENEEPTGDKESVQYQALLTKDGLVWVEPSKTTVEGLATLIEGLDKRVVALEGAVGKAAEGENAATGLFKAIADEAARATAAEKALDEAIKAIDFVDNDELADAIKDFATDKELEDAIKAVEAKIPTDNKDLANGAGYQTASDVATAIANKADKATTLAGYGITDAYTKEEVNTELAKKVDNETYATDKKALEDEDAAIREIAEDAQATVNAFMGTIEAGGDAVDTLQEVLDLISAGDEVATGLLADVGDLKTNSATKTEVSNLSTELNGKIDLKADKTEVSDLSTELNGKIDLKADKTTVEGIDGRVKTLEDKPFDTYATKDQVALDIAAAEGRADAALGRVYNELNTAIGSKADAQEVANDIEAINTAIDGIENQLSNKVDNDSYTETINTINSSIGTLREDVNSINDPEKGILAQAKADATTKANKALEDAKADAANLYATKAYVGVIPNDTDGNPKGSTIIEYINKKADETLAAANGGSSESAASVAQALQNYKDLNDPKVTKNTEDIVTLNTNVSDHGTRIGSLENTINGTEETDGLLKRVASAESKITANENQIGANKEGLAELTNKVNAKAEQTALDATNLNVTNLQTAVANVYTKAEADGKFVAQVEGKDLIATSEITRLANVENYDDAEVRGLIQANADAIAAIDHTEQIKAAVKVETDRAVAKENELDGRITEMEKFWDAADDPAGTIDKLAEIVDYIAKDESGALDMAGDIQQNANDIVTINNKLDGIEAGAEVNAIETISLGAESALAIDENRNVKIPVALQATLGVVKSSAAHSYNEETGMYSGENKVMVAEDGTMEVNAININKLVQNAGDLLILSGGGAE